MGVRGPAPKPAALRQRRNKTSTAANLPSVEDSADNEVPPLPDREGGWLPDVGEWWAAVWRSPMASEYLESDRVGGLLILATLYQRLWSTYDTKEARETSKEIRSLSIEFGLTPMGRRRLQYTIEQGESAADRTAARRESKRPKRSGKDPRELLKAV